MKVVENHPKMLKENKKIFNIGFKTWLYSHFPKRMEQPKWFHSDQVVRISDVVLFIKK